MAEPVPMNETRGEMNRKVWVVNNHSEPYTEVFRGETITIPPNGAKEIQMGYLKAERFLGQPKPPGEQAPDGTWLSTPKALKIVELSDDERGHKRSEPKPSFSCMLCEFEAQNEAGLKRHMTVKHPDAEPIKKDDT